MTHIFISYRPVTVGIVIALIVIAAVIAQVSGIFSGSNESGSTPAFLADGNPTGTPPNRPELTTQQPAPTQWTFTPSATPTPTQTYTPTCTYTPTPNITGTYVKPRKHANQTLTIAASTNTPTTTLAPTITPNPTQIPAGSSNSDWTPVRQAFNGTMMVLVPAGCFMMGSETGESNERPIHEICFDKPFWIDETEVTRAKYAECVPDSGCETAAENEYSTAANQPVNYVSWFMAYGYCAWRNARLPSETEWEYAARGPEGWTYPWGNAFNFDVAIHGDNSNNHAAAVGSIPGGRSWVGAFDMSGNAWEWVNSVYRDYPHTSDFNRADAANDRYPVLRGGGFNNPPDEAFRTTFRGYGRPAQKVFSIGFRCARSYDSAP